MHHFAVIATFLGGMMLQAGALQSNQFNSATIDQFRAIWQKGRPLRIAPRGFKRLNMDGLHAVVSTRPRTARDDAAERRIQMAITKSGIKPLPTDALWIRCRGNICETLFVDRRQLEQQAKSSESNRAGRIAAAASSTCRGADRYPASMIGGLPGGGEAAVSYFCIENAVS